MDIDSVMNILCRICEIQGIGIQNPNKAEKKQSSWRAAFTIGVSFCFTISETLAIFLIDLPDDRLAVAILYSSAHITLTTNLFVAYIKREKISQVIQDLFKNSSFSDIRLSEQASKSAKHNFVWFVACFTLSFAFLFLNEGLLVIKHGVEWRPFALWIPYSGPHHQFIKYFMVIFMCLPMITAFVPVYLIMIMVLIVLRKKFAEISVMIERLDGSSLHYIASLHSAIDQHKKVIKYAEDVKEEFRILFSVQLVQSLAMMSTNNIAFLASERSAAITCRWITMVAVLLLMVGQYSFIAGEVTAKAQDISQSVALCGWEHARGKGKHEVIILLARSQRPIFMDAFGVFPISHLTFITIVKATYSLVAVMI